MTLISNGNAQEVGRWKNNDYDNSHLPFWRREYAMLGFRLMRSLKNSPRSTL